MQSLFFYFVVLVLVASCTKEPKNYVSLSGKIENHNLKHDTIWIIAQLYTKKIKIKPDGTFNDTLMIHDSKLYTLWLTPSYGQVYLKPGYDLHLTMDVNEQKTQHFQNLKFTGIGEETANFVNISSRLTKEMYTKQAENPTVEKYREWLDSLAKGYAVKLDEYSKKGADTAYINYEKQELPGRIQFVFDRYKGGIELEALKKEIVGKPSPSFSNFENAKGGTTSLSDLKGKYVYIDLWATWCGPCKAEFPSLKKLEEEFHNKNITFLSISVDDGLGFKGDKEAAKKAWKKVVLDEELGGVQLISDNGTKSDFFKKYKLNSIPRFILLDPEGKVINPQAPKPSEPNTKSYLESLIK